MTRHPLPYAVPLLLGSILLGGVGWAAEPTKLPADPRLSVAYQGTERFNGVTVSADGRIFVPVQRRTPGTGLEVGEVVDGKLKPYPNEVWNSWSEGHDPASAFVGVNALRIGPDGDLWVIDPGKPSMDEPPVPGSVKLVQIDLASNAVKRIYPLADSAGPQSFVDDFRFNGRTVYLTDAGEKAGIIVLDLDTGKQRRVLDGDKSVYQNGRPLTGDGHALQNKQGKPVVVNADQLEVSPDGKTFYYQPCTGPLYRIDTRLLDDPAAKPEDVAKGVSVYADTHSTGGSAIAGDGTIFISDTDRTSVLAIAPGGAVSTLVQDPKLDWVDAMWIDDAGRLWIPASQRDRTPGMNHGRDDVQPPLQVYTMQVGKAPVRR